MFHENFSTTSVDSPSSPKVKEFKIKRKPVGSVEENINSYSKGVASPQDSSNVPNSTVAGVSPYQPRLYGADEIIVRQSNSNGGAKYERRTAVGSPVLGSVDKRNTRRRSQSVNVSQEPSFSNYNLMNQQNRVQDDMAIQTSLNSVEPGSSRQGYRNSSGERKKLRQRLFGTVIKSEDRFPTRRRPHSMPSDNLLERSEQSNIKLEELILRNKFTKLSIDDALKEINELNIDAAINEISADSMDKIHEDYGISDEDTTGSNSGNFDLAPVTPLKFRKKVARRPVSSPSFDSMHSSGFSNSPIPSMSASQSHHSTSDRLADTWVTNSSPLPEFPYKPSNELIKNKNESSESSCIVFYRILKYSKDLYLTSYSDKEYKYQGKNAGPSYYVEVDVKDNSTEFTLVFKENSVDVMQIEKLNADRMSPGSADLFTVTLLASDGSKSKSKQQLVASRWNISDSGCQYRVETTSSELYKQYFVDNKTKVKVSKPDSKSSKPEDNNRSFAPKIVVDSHEIQFFILVNGSPIVLAKLIRRKKAADRFVTKMKRISGTSSVEETNSLVAKPDQADKDVFGWLYIYAAIEQQDPCIWKMAIGLTLAVAYSQRLEDKL